MATQPNSPEPNNGSGFFIRSVFVKIERMIKYQLNNFTPAGRFKIDYRSELNEEQYRAVTQGDGPCLVLAGAGSGKTRTLVYRVAYLLERGVKPNRILLVTFTNKAAKEMLSRIDSLLKTATKGLWGGTFHHIGNRLLRQYGSAIGLKPNFNILDAEDAKALVKAALASVAIPEDKYFPKAEMIYKIISLAANLSRPLAEVIDWRFGQIDKDYVPLIEQIAASYQQRKNQSNALDFDDLLSLWARLLRESPEVRQKLANQFEHVLVDEYQDTNHLQGEIVAALAGASPNIFVVGDDSQSIYSFRGADVNNILDFPKIFSQAQTFKLETNYRSTPEILALANQSISYNQNQFVKKLKTNKPAGSRPAVVPLSDNSQQAEFICQRILDLGRDEGLNLKEVAILFRAHYQSLELELALNKRNIPYVMRGGLRFFEQAHIKEVIAFLKILVNCHDELAWQRLLLFQPGIGLVGAQKIYQQLLDRPDLAAITSSPVLGLPMRAQTSFGRLQQLVARISSGTNYDIAAIIKSIIESDYREQLKNNYDNYQDRLADLEQLALFAANYDDLAKFLADTALGESFKGESLAGYQAGADEAVVLSTIHQAKGLEWPAVFILGLLDGQFPNTKAFERLIDLEEERRLFYVAVTRAQDYLYLTYPLFSLATGNLNQPSQFIKELPQQVYEPWQVDEAESDEVIYVEEEESVTDNFWRRVKARRENEK